MDQLTNKVINKPSTASSPLSKSENAESLSGRQVNLNDLFPHVQVLVDGINVAQKKGAYSLKEASVLNSAIEGVVNFTNSINSNK